MEQKIKILIVDDEPNILELIKMNLEGEFEIYTASTGMDAILEVKSKNIDIILLDLMLPDIDGEQVCKMLKNNSETSQIPIIMLTAKSTESDKVRGLEIGADDYMTKPFGLRELEARIRTVIRRSKQYTPTIKQNTDSLQFRDLSLDLKKYEVLKNDEIIDFTLTELKILKLLIENSENVVSRESILTELGIKNTKNEGRVLDVHMLNIRKKLRGDSDDEYIDTIRGIGYRMK